MTEPSAPLRQRLRDAAYEAMLDSAEQVMIAKGYDGATMQEIAAQAGCAIGTFYVHFRNKEVLFQATIARHFRALATAMRQAADTVDNPLEKLRLHIDVLLDYFNAHRPFFRLFFLAMPRRHDVMQQSLEESARTEHEEFRRHEIETVEMAQRMNLIRSDFPPETVLDFMRSFVLGTLEQFSLRPATPDKDEQLRLIWGFLTHGIGARTQSTGPQGSKP
jgi:AcrR family transcriptional regulator